MLGAIIPESLRQLFKKAATNLYPFEKFPVPAGFRGKLVADEPLCIGCKICVRDCPAQALEIVTVAEKSFKVVIYLDRCISCGQCIDSCPKKLFSFLDDHEYSAKSRTELKIG